MNIFVLDQTASGSAEAQCDRHVVKMTLETAQLLSTAVNELGGSAPYKTTHRNHPCAVWARATLGNFNWLLCHGLALATEYTFRYGKVHKSQAVIEQCGELVKAFTFFTDPTMTQHPLTMPDRYKSACPVASYRDYYRHDKKQIAQWNKQRVQPAWWA
jgi:hypothetical protein